MMLGCWGVTALGGVWGGTLSWDNICQLRAQPQAGQCGGFTLQAGFLAEPQSCTELGIHLHILVT